MKAAGGRNARFRFTILCAVILTAVLCMGVGAAAAGDSSEAGGYRNGVNLSTVNATLAEDTAIQPEDPSRTPGKNDRTGTAGSMSAMRRALLPGNNTVVLPYAVNDSDGLPLYLLQPDVTTQPVQEVQEVPEPIRVVQEPTGAVQGPIGIFQGNEGSELFRFLNRYGIDPVLLLGVVSILAAAGGALLYRFIAAKRRRTDDAHNNDAGGVADETVAVTSSWYSQSFPGEASVMDGSLGSTYFPPPLTDRYQDVRFIGKGGVARVFSAKRKNDGEEVAVKVPISFDEVTGKMFLKEMRIWEHLSHPNIVTLFSVNILPVPFVEMEYLPGSLAGQNLPLEPAKAVEIVRGITEGVMYAHVNGIIHRDIKPQNILITGDGVPKIADWGLGSVLADGHETTTLGFSLNYAAPEQIAPTRYGSPDKRTDIYGVGVVFYECVTGVRPFLKTGVAEMTAAILEDVPQAPSFYNRSLQPLDAVILRCLEKNPDDRFSSAEELLEALDEAGDTYPPDS